MKKYNKMPLKFKSITNHNFYYSNELWYSKSYQSLTIAGRELLHSLVCELRWSGRGKKMLYTNNGDLSFTETDFKKRYGYQSATYLRARNDLIKTGLIKQTYKGGYCRGDRAKYRLLFVKGVPLIKQRWREYPNRDWEIEIPRNKQNIIGKNTRFKKGNSGRKNKTTLFKDTLNGLNDPKALVPSKYLSP